MGGDTTEMVVCPQKAGNPSRLWAGQDAVRGRNGEIRWSLHSINSKSAFFELGVERGSALTCPETRRMLPLTILLVLSYVSYGRFTGHPFASAYVIETTPSIIHSNTQIQRYRYALSLLGLCRQQLVTSQGSDKVNKTFARLSA